MRKQDRLKDRYDLINEPKYEDLEGLSEKRKIEGKGKGKWMQVHHHFDPGHLTFVAVLAGGTEAQVWDSSRGKRKAARQKAEKQRHPSPVPTSSSEKSRNMS